MATKKILVIDDDRLFLAFLERSISAAYPDLQLTTCADPFAGLKKISADLDLLLLDLEMPGLDGKKLLDYAKATGLKRSNIIILSGREADDLHQLFPMGECLAVLNKHEARQKAVLDMILQALQGKARTGDENGVPGCP
ncbi:MAG: response regulator [Desulfuromonadales bacterium]|nr:response regulator [Desulfuromonadales bacterium]